MQKTMKKTLSIILAILMIVTTIPMAFAADLTAHKVIDVGYDQFAFVKNEFPVANYGHTYAYSEGPGNLFDGYDNTKFCVVIQRNFNFEEYCDYLYISLKTSNGTPASISGYQFITGNDAPERDPLTWKLYGSNDQSEWILIDSRENADITRERNSAVNFALDENSESYVYFKFVFEDLRQDTNVFQLSEIKLFEPHVLEREACGGSICGDCGLWYGAGEPSHEKYTNGVCNACGSVCKHTGMEDGKCDVCSFECAHADAVQDCRGYYCADCLTFYGEAGEHSFVNDICSVCGIKGGNCGENGDNVTWLLDTEGLLIISGKGNIYNYQADGVSSPFAWNSEVKSVVIEDGITNIPENLFNGCENLESVIIGNDVESIEKMAFYCCRSLENLTIGNSVKSIGEDAFLSNDNLKSVVIPDSVESIGIYAFFRCISLEDLTIGKGVKSIGEKAFSECKALESVIIPGNVETIGDSAFSYCEKLKTLTISEGVKYIGDMAFSSCQSLKSITIPDGIDSISYAAFSGCRKLESVTIPNSVTSIGGLAFSNCQSLKSITIPNSVTSIANNAFNYCTNLNSITVDDSNLHYLSEDGVLFNKEKTNLIKYPEGNSRTDYTIPESVTNIDENAFSKCTNIKSITIPNSVKSIGESAFNDCTGINSIRIPDSVTRIGYSAFAGCTGLKSIIISDSVTSIGDTAFIDCSSLENLIIGSKVESIGRDAIFMCDALKTLHFTGTETQWEAIAKPDDTSDLLNTIAVHYGALDEKAGFAATCGVDGYTVSFYCDECDNCITGEVIPATGDHDWSNKDGICKVCSAECVHEDYNQERIRPVQNADGTWSKGTVKAICSTCGFVASEKEVERDHEGYAAFEESITKYEALLNREDLVDGPKNDYAGQLNNLKNAAYSLVYMEDEETVTRIKAIADSFIVEIEAGLADGTMKKADWTYMTELFEEINAIIDNDYHNIISSMNSYYLGPQGYYNGCSNSPTFTQASYNGNIHFEKQLETLLAGLKDGSALKADYTEIDEAIAEIEKKLADENVTDEAKADLEEIKSQLEEMKQNPISSEADLAELEKALEDYETELDAGIEDGTAVKVDGFTVYTERGREWLLKFADEGIFEKARELILNSTEVKAKLDEIYDFALSLEGNVAENAENIAKIEADIDEFFGQLKKCVYGIHNVSQYKEISPAKCGENAIESATCTLCGETVTREVENSALTHSFTKYEETEAPKCGVEGKEVAYCDHGCGETDEKAIEALKHSFTKYEVTEEAKCGVEGKEVAYCDNGCGETDEKAIEALKHSFTKYEVTEEAKCGVEGKEVATCDNGCGATDEKAIAALTHKDADGDYKCDNGCGHEFEKPAPEEPTPDTPDEPTDSTCDHLCHKSGILGFFWKIVKFFSKLFKLNPVCECGAAHY